MLTQRHMWHNTLHKNQHCDSGTPRNNHHSDLGTPINTRRVSDLYAPRFLRLHVANWRTDTIYMWLPPIHSQRGVATTQTPFRAVARYALDIWSSGANNINSSTSRGVIVGKRLQCVILYAFWKGRCALHTQSEYIWTVTLHFWAAAQNMQRHCSDPFLLCVLFIAV